MQILCSDLLANSITDPNGVCELKDSSTMVFMDEFSNFSTFSVVLRVLGRPERSSSSTDAQRASKHECHSKAAAQLKECSHHTKHFKGFSSRFTELHTKLDADILLNFAINCRQNKT
jgi:hypothetical protein